jgi:dienelactone hydrolase
MNEEKATQRQKLYKLLGDLPMRASAISATKIAVEEHQTYLLEKLILDLNGMESVPAYFVKPKEAAAKLPTIIFNHSHGGNYSLGKDELLQGSCYLQKPDYATELTAKGYAVLAIDAWAFGERRGRLESEIFKQMLWSGQVMWGMMVYDSLKAFDYLVARPDVDSSRIGTLGLSMGSTMAWWLAALEVRIKVCIDICCLTDYQALIDNRGLDEHGIYYYVPALLKHFTSAQINALIAPRPHLALAGNYDRLTPVDGLERIDEELKNVYRREQAEDAWHLKRYDCGHLETAAMRKEVLAFLEKWL